MSLKNFFSRNKEVVDVVTSEAKTRHSKNEIACDTAKLKKMITEWTRSGGWKFENFADFIELIGVKTPVKLSEWDEESYSFKCVTALDTEIRISLAFSDLPEIWSEIHITDGKETRNYITNNNMKKGKSLPRVGLFGRNIEKSGKELNSYYDDGYFCHTLKIDDTHVLKVEIYEPDNHKHEEEFEILVLRNCEEIEEYFEEIEEYLLGLDNSLVVDAVYEKIIELLNFSNGDIFKCEKILISYMLTKKN